MRGNDEKVSISFHVNWLWRIPYSPSGRKDKNIGSPITQVPATNCDDDVIDDNGEDEDDFDDGEFDTAAANVFAKFCCCGWFWKVLMTDNYVDGDYGDDNGDRGGQRVEKQMHLPDSPVLILILILRK